MLKAPDGPDWAVELTYWFLRLNGCLTITNFLLHPPSRGGLRTDADVVGVRSSFRSEYRMRDHVLFEGSPYLEVVIAEVKTSGPCTLNGPWTQRDKRNIDHLLAALGLAAPNLIAAVALALYANGEYLDDDSGVQYRLLTFAASKSADLARDFPRVPQITWDETLRFIHYRLNTHARQKKDHEQWPLAGRWLYEMAVRRPIDEFLRKATP